MENNINFLWYDTTCTDKLSFSLLTLSISKNLHVQSAAITLQVTTATRSYFDQIGSIFCFQKECLPQSHSYSNCENRLKINEEAKQESHLCFRPGDGIVERPLAPRPPTARTAEPVLAQLGSEQTAAASLGPMPSETAGCTLNFSANRHIAEKPERFKKKFTWNFCVTILRTDPARPPTDFGLPCRIDPHHSHSSPCSNPTRVSSLPYWAARYEKKNKNSKSINCFFLT